MALFESFDDQTSSRMGPYASSLSIMPLQDSTITHVDIGGSDQKQENAYLSFAEMRNLRKQANCINNYSTIKPTHMTRNTSSSPITTNPRSNSVNNIHSAKKTDNYPLRTDFMQKSAEKILHHEVDLTLPPTNFIKKVDPKNAKKGGKK